MVSLELRSTRTLMNGVAFAYHDSVQAQSRVKASAKLRSGTAMAEDQLAQNPLTRNLLQGM